MAVIHVEDQDFKTKVDAGEKLIVKFYADWCGSCKLVAPKFRRLSDGASASDVQFLEVNAETSPEARKLAGVSNLPFFATFAHGKLVEAFATSKEDILSEMIAKLN
jgi:thiol-disulfide isomerase/thioredoxin